MVRTKEFEPDTALARAVDVFWERGYEKTSLQNLVDRMGIGRRSLYDTFGDKHTLFLRAMERYGAHLGSEQLEIIDRAADARQAVRILLETSLAEGLVLRRGCLTVNTATEATTEDAEASALVQRQFAKARQLLRDLIDRGRREGSITGRGDSAALTAVVFNAWLGLRVRVRSGASLDELMADVNAILTLLD